jgi:hypothetical protein
VRKLADMPGMGHRRRDVKDARLLYWAVHPYLIVYRFTRRTVYILRVVHGSRDLRKLFRSALSQGPSGSGAGGGVENGVSPRSRLAMSM